MAENESASKPGTMRRRAALTAMGGAGLGVAGFAVSRAVTRTPAKTGSLTAAGRLTACVLTPEETEGPYYADLEMVRRNITEGYPGLPLLLRTTLVDTATCVPLAGAALDIWHCNALGEYSGYTSLGIGGDDNGKKTAAFGAAPTPGAARPGKPGPPPKGKSPGGAGAGGGHTKPTDKLTFLRGVQLSDSDGVVEFQTIYPGWYLGRAIHIHVKVHVGGRVTGTHYSGGHVSHSGQFFFAEDMTEKIAKLAPYHVNRTVRTKNSDDTIFKGGHGSGLLTLTPSHSGQTSLADGLHATIVVGVNPESTPAAVGM